MAFKTHVKFEDHSTVVEDTPEDKIQDTIMRLLRGPAAQLGMIKEVRIVDTWDNTVFLARDNNVVFPSREDCAKALQDPGNTAGRA